MGIINNFNDFSTKTIIIVGIGGVGSVLSEMLVRCGIGKLIIYDYDYVEMANMNRLFYTPDQVGLSKVQAAKNTLNKINDKVQIDANNCNINEQQYYNEFKQKILYGNLYNNNRVDLVISCVDNYIARMTINSICNELQQIWFESGVSEDALSCHYQIIIPGETACFACIPPLAFIEKNEQNIKREGVCTASLPTTMSMTAGFLAHTAMKYILEFEDIQYYLQYNAKNEYFVNDILQPNKECIDKNCRKNQEILQQKMDKQNNKDSNNNNNNNKQNKEQQQYQQQLSCKFIERRQYNVQQKREQQKQNYKNNNNKDDNEDYSKWNIEVIEDSEEQQIEFISQKELKEQNIEDLMKKLQAS